MTSAESEVEPKRNRQGGVEWDVGPEPLACRKLEKANKPCGRGWGVKGGGGGWLYGIITRKKKSFDFYTAPDCWKRKSDVFNKYPKYFLAPLDFFF